MTHNPAALISALKKIEGLSTVDGIDPEADAMMIDGASDGNFATHPSIADRIAILVRLSGGMALIAASRKDTRPVALQMGYAGRGFGRRGLTPPTAVATAAAPRTACDPEKPRRSLFQQPLADWGDSGMNVFGPRTSPLRGMKRNVLFFMAAVVALQWLISPGGGLVQENRSGSTTVERLPGGTFRSVAKKKHHGPGQLEIPEEFPSDLPPEER
jgi:hypothetical protein